MSINYFKENLKKFDPDNLVSFLFDIVLRIDLDEIEDYDATKQYYLHDKIYYKDAKGRHHIYNCLVEEATVGNLVPVEWIDLVQSFRKPIITEETLVASVEVKQEVLVSTVANQREFELKTRGVAEGGYTILVYHSELGKLTQTDFVVSGKYVILNEDCAMKEVGGRLIVDLFSKG